MNLQQHLIIIGVSLMLFGWIKAILVMGKRPTKTFKVIYEDGAMTRKVTYNEAWNLASIFGGTIYKEIQTITKE